MKKTVWMAIFLNVRWKPKGSVSIKETTYCEFASKDEALAYAGNYHNCLYVNAFKNKKVFIAWAGHPSYGYSDYPHVIIVKDQPGFSFSHTDRRLRERLQEMWNDWFDKNNRGINNKLYPDWSIKLSRLAWQTSIPKGWQLLRVGSIIKNTDKEFDDISTSRRCWLPVSWYNVGKKVKRETPILFYKLQDGKQVFYKKEPGHPTPLIIRKTSK